MADCEKYEKDFIDYLDGTLDGERLEMFVKHLRSCAVCSHRLETMRVLLEETANLSVEVPDGLHDQIIRCVRHEQKRRGLLRFTSRRTVAAAAAVVLIGAASVYGVAHTKYFAGADTAGDARMMAENSTSLSALQAEDSGAALDGVYYDIQTEGSAQEDSADVYGVAPTESSAQNSAEQGEEDSAALEAKDVDSTFFSQLAADERYASVVVMDASTVPVLLEEYLTLPDESVAETADGDEVHYMIVPASEADEIIAACQTDEIKLKEYNTEHPVPDATVIDGDAENSLIILRITE